MNIIYLHGFASSGKSNTAKLLRELLQDDNVISPDIPVNPIEALQLLLSLAGKYSADDTIIIGTSMGAMYASQMKKFPRILINPAFHVSELLKEHLNEDMVFLSPREDGEENFFVSELLCDEFEDMERGLMIANEVAPNNVIGLFGSEDYVCNCIDEYQERYYYWTEFQGGHRLTEEVIKDVLIPIITWMSKKQSDEMIMHIPFNSVCRGDVGWMGSLDNDDNSFKIYDKGIGRKWYEKMVRKHHGEKHYDGNEVCLRFPRLQSSVDENTVELVYGNFRNHTPSIEIYGEGGIKIPKMDFYITDTIHIFRAGH